MTKPHSNHFLRLAEDAEAMAARADDPKRRAFHRRAAEEWRYLAGELKRQERKASS